MLYDSVKNINNKEFPSKSECATALFWGIRLLRNGEAGVSIYSTEADGKISPLARPQCIRAYRNIKTILAQYY